jgi:hypothetical protein
LERIGNLMPIPFIYWIGKVFRINSDISWQAQQQNAKQRQEMLSKGFVRKDIWLSKESLDLIEK